MFSNRSLLLVSFVAFCWGASAPSVPGQNPPTVQTRIQPSPVQQQPIQQQPIQTQPMQTQQIQMQPIPLGTQGGQTQPMPLGTPGRQSVYQVPAQPMGHPVAAQVPPGMNVGQPNMGQPNMTAQPVQQPIHRVAAVPGPQPPMTQPLAGQPAPQIIQPGAAGAGQVPPPGMMHVGRAEPASRVVRFPLNPNEQRELDEFLARWERYSAAIKQYDVEFYMLEFEADPTMLGTVSNRPQRTSFGHFKYNSSPMRFLYVIEGEWRDNNHVKRDGDKNPHIHAEKTIIDEKTVFKYDYNDKTVHKINVPPEMIGKGIADSPLPLIFGAKADELKRRFSMKIEHKQDGFIVLYARPLLIEDQQEFKELEIMLDKDLRARGLRQYDINDTGYKVFDLRSTNINPLVGNLIEHVRRWFNPEVPRGWKLEEHHWVQQPSPALAMPQAQMGTPPQNVFPPQQGVPLYRGQ